MASGSEPTEAIYDIYLQYTAAYDIVDAIIADQGFISDYATMEEYWALSDRARNGELSVKDAVRLFCSNEPMTLVINDGRMNLLAEGEVIPVEERKEDYDMIGRVRPTVDSHIDGKQSDYILSAEKYFVPVDVDAAIASGIITEEDRVLVTDKIYVTIDETVLTKDRLMMLDLLAHFGWERPLSFTQTHIMKDYGVADYARFDGYAYTLVPIRTPYRSGAEVGYIDLDKVYPRFIAEEGNEEDVERALRYGNLADEDVLVDYFYRFNLSAARSRENFARLASGFIRRNGEGDLERAEKLLDKGLEVLPAEKLGYSHTAVLPYIRGYYTIAQSNLERAVIYLEEAVATFDRMLGSQSDITSSNDIFGYFYDLSDRAQVQQTEARSRNIDTIEADRLLVLSDEAFGMAEDEFRKGDTLAAEYISKRGEWVGHYLQYTTYRSFTPMISDQLYNAVLDIIEALRLSHEVSGSFDWVAGTDSEMLLVENALIFDNMVEAYLEAIKRLTPADSEDVAMSLVELHICNLFEIYSNLPSSRYAADSNGTAKYIDALVEYLERPEVYDILTAYYGE